MAPHNQPTLARVVPAIGVSAPATGQRLSSLEKSVLQHREVSSAVACRNDHLAIYGLATAGYSFVLLIEQQTLAVGDG